MRRWSGDVEGRRVGAESHLLPRSKNRGCRRTFEARGRREAEKWNQKANIKHCGVCARRSKEERRKEAGRGEEGPFSPLSPVG